MRTSLRVLAIAVVLAAIGVSVADACYCGATQYRFCKPACCCKADCCCQWECHTVMKTCKQVVCEIKEETRYRTVYKEVTEEKPVDAVKYVEELQCREVAQAVCQPCCETSCCEPADCCQPTCCKPVTCMKMVPCKVFKPVPDQKTEKIVRIVETQEPYTVPVCVCKEVVKEVPVEVCCPVPCCCRPTCCGQ